MVVAAVAHERRGDAPCPGRGHGCAQPRVEAVCVRCECAAGGILALFSPSGFLIFSVPPPRQLSCASSLLPHRRYRNAIKALPWFTSVRDKLLDKAYWGWFLAFKGCNPAPGVYTCGDNATLNLYHVRGGCVGMCCAVGH